MSDREWLFLGIGSAQAFALAGVYGLVHGVDPGFDLGLMTMGAAQGFGVYIGWRMRR